MPAPRYNEATYDSRAMPTMSMQMQMCMQPRAQHQYYAGPQPQYRHPPPPPSHGYMQQHHSDWRLHESDVDARARCESINSHGPSPNCSAPSPSGDGKVLPTLSTMLNTTWSSSPRWQPGEPTQQMSPAPRLGARRPGTEDLTVATSPLLSSASGALNGRSSWGMRAAAHNASHQIKTEPALRPAFSPIHDPARKVSVDDEMDEDTNTDAMVISSRASCSSPSSYSTISEQPEGKCSSPVTKERKTSRYLREMDRRAILERLARGEKQATLAKEYHVSRAAICNLFKHRHEVMSRTDEDPFAKHPKKRKNKKTLKSRRSRSLRLATANTANGNTRAVVTPPAAPGRVHQVQSDAVLLLLTVMSDRRSSADEFRRASERVVWLLIEEALSVVPIKLTQVSINSDAKIMGVTTEHPPCAISMEQHSSPMLEVFQLLEPERPVGHIRIDMRDGQSLRLSDTQLPATLKYHNVFLFDVAVVSSDTLRNMIECVKERGALEVMIYVVALFISAEVVETLEETYPHVRIVTTQIESNIMESQKSRRSCVDVVLGRFDQVYQTQYTLV